MVNTRNRLAHRLKLEFMVQGVDETITSFETRLKQVARSGGFQVECTTCKGLNNYTDQMVIDNLIRGLADEEIMREVLATPDTECNLNKVSGFLVSEESVMSRPPSHIRKQQQQGGQVKAVPRQCNNCETGPCTWSSGLGESARPTIQNVISVKDFDTLR